MFCENCGQELNEGAKFCSNCGTPIGDNNAVQVQQVQQVAYPYYGKEINGVTVNAAEIAIKTGLFDYTNSNEKAEATKNTIELIKTLTGAGMMKATFNASMLENDKELKGIVVAFKSGVPSPQPITVVNDADELRCPKCGSVHIEIDKKGFSGGKAIVGGLLAGPIGIAAGFMGKNKRKRVCLKCGHTW